MGRDFFGEPFFGAMLFTPGDRPERFAKGADASRGALVLDLEDGVSPERKAAAREAVSEWLASGRGAMVRINPVGTPSFHDDVVALRDAPLAAIVVPKAESPADLRKVREAWPRAFLYPLVETPRALERLGEICKTAGVRQLMLGALDLHVSLAMPFPNASLLAYARLKLAMSSSIGGLAPPIDSPYPDFSDLNAVAADATDAARAGFAGKLCIHPAQLAVVNRAFAPSKDELAWAREVLAAGESGGAVAVRGAMVDAPVIASARRILARGEMLALS